MALLQTQVLEINPVLFLQALGCKYPHCSPRYAKRAVLTPCRSSCSSHRAQQSPAAERLCWNSQGTTGFHGMANNRIIRRADTGRGLSVSSRPALCFGKGCPVLANQQSDPDPTADGAEA